jgi:hypothetical protein
MGGYAAHLVVPVKVGNVGLPYLPRSEQCLHYPERFFTESGNYYPRCVLIQTMRHFHG